MFETSTATDYLDLLERLDAFLTTNGSAFGLGYAGTGNGTLTGYRGGASSIAETFAITATSATTFSVVGSVSGSLGTATVGTPFSHAKLAFTINAGGTAFVAGDVFTLSTAPKWTSLRKARGCTVTASSGTTGANGVDNLIDGKAAGPGETWVGGAPAQQVEFTFLAAETIVEYALNAGNASGPRTWTFEYWNGSSWVVLDTRTLVAWSASFTWQTFAIASPVSATRYRLNVSAGYSGSSLTIAAVQLRRSAGGFDAAFGQYLWQAPGNDGAGAFVVGIHHFRRLDADYFDWELAAFDGFGAALDWSAQPGVHDDLYVPLVNSSMPYWFVANGRRVVVVAKVGSQYETAYLGPIAPYFSPGQVPYPMALGGSLAFDSAAKPGWSSTSWRWSNATNAHRAFTHSDPNTSFDARPVSQYHLRLRRPDGTWFRFAASYADAFSSPQDEDGWIWPYAGDFSLLDALLDGGAALWPVVLTDPVPNTYGQLDGVLAVSGQDLTAESLVRLGAVDHLVVQNVNRADRNDWLAVGLD